MEVIGKNQQKKIKILEETIEKQGKEMCEQNKKIEEQRKKLEDLEEILLKISQTERKSILRQRGALLIPANA